MGLDKQFENFFFKKDINGPLFYRHTHDNFIDNVNFIENIKNMSQFDIPADFYIYGGDFITPDDFDYIQLISERISDINPYAKMIVFSPNVDDNTKNNMIFKNLDCTECMFKGGTEPYVVKSDVLHKICNVLDIDFNNKELNYFKSSQFSPASTH